MKIGLLDVDLWQWHGAWVQIATLPAAHVEALPEPGEVIPFEPRGQHPAAFADDYMGPEEPAP